MKQVKELNNTIQDLKTESQRETTLDIENLGKKLGVIDVRINNRIQEIEERISGAEDTIENIDITVKKCKMQKSPNPNNPGNPVNNEKTKPKDNRCRREQSFPT